MSLSTVHRILVIEDDEQFVELVQRILKSDYLGNVEISVAYDLATAKKRIATAPYDAILLDLTLPDSKGLHTVYEVVRCIPGVIPVVVAMSGWEQSLQEQEEMICLGANTFILKEEIASMSPGFLRRIISYAYLRVTQQMRDLTKSWEELVKQIKDESGVDAEDHTMGI